jgi:hypothetical protein
MSGLQPDASRICDLRVFDPRPIRSLDLRPGATGLSSTSEAREANVAFDPGNVPNLRSRYLGRSSPDVPRIPVERNLAD